VGAGLNLLEGYENVDGYDNEQRQDFFQTPVTKFVKAEALDATYEPDSVAEIRIHHVFEHISMLDVDRTLRSWNHVLKMGGLVWVEVPDFGGCAREILRSDSEADKEIYFRHIFGSQMGPGEFHKNGLTAPRLIKLLADYGFETKLAVVRWSIRKPHPIHMCYPKSFPLPDLTIKALKVGAPSPRLDDAPYTHINYRKVYPNREFPEPAVTKS
jgi:predicted SAM-dependent methyltransferase